MAAFILFLLLALIVIAVIFGVMSLSALLLMWAWNLVMPLLWSAAPILTFWPAFALSVLLSFVGNIFRRAPAVKID